MSRAATQQPQEAACFTRVSGDEPFDKSYMTKSNQFSPREWG